MIDTSTQFTQIALGIDRLYQAQTSRAGFLEQEGLAVVNLSNLSPILFADWVEADKALIGLDERLPEEPDQRPLFFQYLYQHMHTATTLATHWPNHLLRYT